MNRQDRQQVAAFRNQRLLERERFAISHYQKFDNSPKIIQGKSDKDSELFCACNSLKCDGICREQHLNRPRFANPKPKKDVGINKMWAERCPSAYEKPKNYRT